ncbi:MAG: 1-deoxy-D-xylulose-5-phosphate reductoisomerase [Melioribacter sp.]|nr:1-deoxy-D-xylulose-5-phosphate reductoisomerase [Melioribacter sp.]
MKKILILGSTGSIGKNALEIIRNFKNEFRVTGLTVNDNIDLLEEQIKEFNPSSVVVKNKDRAKELRKRISSKCNIIEGEEGLLEVTKYEDYDILLSAIVGFAGLKPTIEAIKRGKRIALANKETLVVAGEIIIKLSKEYNSEIIPVDSEHSAIFQCIKGEDVTEVNKIILTASGGPFLNKSKEEFCNVTISEALNHPNWKMGNKISIDSATMMNKGLEIIEAYWLFGLPKEKIEVTIHPQSIIHSMVQFRDGSIKAQLSLPDMKLPILYALSYPHRLKYNQVITDIKKIGQLTFFEPDFDKFVCLKLAYDVIDQGGTAPCILNAANEVAVEKFLKGKIKFSQIPEIIEEALNVMNNHKNVTLENIIETDAKTREFLNKKYRD